MNLHKYTNYEFHIFMHSYIGKRFVIRKKTKARLKHLNQKIPDIRDERSYLNPAVPPDFSSKVSNWLPDASEKRLNI